MLLIKSQIGCNSVPLVGYKELGANIMKTFFYIIILLFLFGCSNSDEEKLNTNSTVNKVFDQTEIRDLEKILNFFDEQVCTIQMIKIDKTDDCYLSFFERILQAQETGYLELGISFEEQLKMYNQINNSSFNQIWFIGKSWRDNSTDTLKHIGIRGNGKYIDFLKELSKDDEGIKDYYDTFKAFGEVPPSLVAEVLVNYDKYNIKDVRVRLVMAIHYITLNDQSLRKEKY